MKRTTWELLGSLTLFDLDGLREALRPHERKIMDRKKALLRDFHGWRDIKDIALAEKMFELGYLAAHTFHKDDEKQ